MKNLILIIAVCFFPTFSWALSIEECKKTEKLNYQTDKANLANFKECYEADYYAKDVRKFVENDIACVNLSGEWSDDAGQNKLVEEGLKKYCPSITRRNKLIEKYKNNSLIVEAIKNYGEAYAF